MCEFADLVCIPILALDAYAQHATQKLLSRPAAFYRSYRTVHPRTAINPPPPLRLAGHFYNSAGYAMPRRGGGVWGAGEGSVGIGISHGNGDGLSKQQERVGENFDGDDRFDLSH